MNVAKLRGSELYKGYCFNNSNIALKGIYSPKTKEAKEYWEKDVYIVIFTECLWGTDINAVVFFEHPDKEDGFSVAEYSTRHLGDIAEDFERNTEKSLEASYS